LRMMQSDDSFFALPDESKATILLMQDKGFTRGYIGVGKESGSAREQPPVREATVLTPTKVESSASEDDMNQDSGTDNGETSSELALASSAAIHLGTLEFPQGAYGQGSTVYRKTWHSYFFVLLVRKSSLGMFATQAEHLAGSEPHAAVFKLRYTLRIRSQPKRPHQFRLTHSSKGGGSPKKPLHFAALPLLPYSCVALSLSVCLLSRSSAATRSSSSITAMALMSAAIQPFISSRLEGCSSREVGGGAALAFIMVDVV
ncbi:hypothetical protein PR002_g28137, partial [Phytophthora rubi]